MATAAARMNRIGEEEELKAGQEETEDLTTPVEEDDDDDSSEEDEDAHLKQIKPGKMHGSIRRNDSFTSFLTRSERNLILGKDQPPPPDVASKRAVKFRDDQLENVREVSIVDDEDKPKLWLNNNDFDRMETDISLTKMRWDNHVNGHIEFDESKNTLRGLEHLDRPSQKQKEMSKYKHNQSVLQEIHRQKIAHGSVRDWELVRRASEDFSRTSQRHAEETAQKDLEAYKRAWGEQLTGNDGDEEAGSGSSRPSSSKKKGKKKKNPLLFWQKK